MDQQELQALLPSAEGQDWRASSLLHRQVVNARNVEPVGRVTDVVFDPESCQLAALAVDASDATRTVSSVARRAFGGTRTTMYISAEHIIALNGDVVTVDLDAAHPAQLPHAERLPHLSQVRNLTVITLHGIHLGHFVDLLLDTPGRHLTGYLINPTRRAAAVLRAPEPSIARAPEAAPPQEATEVDGEAQMPPTPAEPLPANMRIIPASPRVRVGRSLILVVETVEPLRREDVVVSRPVSSVSPVSMESARERTRAGIPSGVASWDETKVPLEGSEAADAPTQQLR